MYAVLVMDGDYPERYFPTADSPVIDAGDPEADLDLDGTIADIGAFFFPLPNISLDRYEIEFADVQIGRNVETELLVTNIGLDWLVIDEIVIIEDDVHFGFDYEWNAIEPDSSAIIWITFRANEQDSYEAVLRIESNDRDEGVLDVPQLGNALSVSQSTAKLPTEVTLYTAAPNPFNSTTRVRYFLPAAGEVRLSIYVSAGRLVQTLSDGWQVAGDQRAILQGSDLPAGVYLLRLETGSAIQTRKVVLLK